MLLLNRSVTVKTRTKINIDKEIKTIETIHNSNLKCRIMSNRSQNQFDQKEQVLGKIDVNKLVMYCRKPIPKGAIIVDNKTNETWNVIGDSADMAGNGYLFFVEVEVLKE